MADTVDRVLSAPCGVCGEPATGLVNGAGFTPSALPPRWEPRCDAHSPWRGRHIRHGNFYRLGDGSYYALGDGWDDADDTDDDAYDADDDEDCGLWAGVALILVGVFLAALAVAGLLRLIEALRVGWRL